jgi:signal transduction histidine kinase
MPILMEQGLGVKPDYYSEYIDAARFPDPTYAVALRDYIKLKYGDMRFDLVVATQQLALNFLTLYRDELFPDTPVVFVTEDAGVHRISNSTGRIIRRDYGLTLALALELQPETTQVFVVGGNSASDQRIAAEARPQLDRFSPKLTFTYLSNLDTDHLERTVGALPEQSIIYYLIFYQDVAGVNVNPLDYLDRLSAIANRPIYSWVDSTINRGVLGGSLLSIDAEIDVIADLATRVLRGEPADSIPLETRTANTSVVDWRQLARWRIPEARVPAGTQILFRSPSPWERYKSYIAAVTALVLVQAAFITVLLVQRTRLRHAKARIRGSQAELVESYQRLRDVGGRLLTAQDAENARIARELHDDVSQQLALISIELQLVGNTVHETSGGRLNEILDHVQGVVATVHRLSHRLHPAKLRLMGLVAAITGLQRDMSRPEFTVTFTHENVPPVLPPEVTLALFRVVQEALRNAAEHSGASAVSVHLTAADGLHLTVTDDGEGFDVATAWGIGLGLISMEERLAQLGGTLAIHSSPGSGTRLEVSVPEVSGHVVEQSAAV